MGVTWCLECTQCEKARILLMQLDHDDAAEAIESDFDFDAHNGPVDTVELMKWIEKHKTHGPIIFTGH